MKKDHIFEVLAGTSLLLACGSLFLLVKNSTKFKSETGKILLAMLAKAETDEERDVILDRLSELKYL